MMYEFSVRGNQLVQSARTLLNSGRWCMQSAYASKARAGVAELLHGLRGERLAAEYGLRHALQRGLQDEYCIKYT